MTISTKSLSEEQLALCEQWRKIIREEIQPKWGEKFREENRQWAHGLNGRQENFGLTLKRQLEGYPVFSPNTLKELADRLDLPAKHRFRVVGKQYIIAMMPRWDDAGVKSAAINAGWLSEEQADALCPPKPRASKRPAPIPKNYRPDFAHSEDPLIEYILNIARARYIHKDSTVMAVNFELLREDEMTPSEKSAYRPYAEASISKISTAIGGTAYHQLIAQLRKSPKPLSKNKRMCTLFDALHFTDEERAEAQKLFEQPQQEQSVARVSKAR